MLFIANLYQYWLYLCICILKIIVLTKLRNSQNLCKRWNLFFKFKMCVCLKSSNELKKLIWQLSRWNYTISQIFNKNLKQNIQQECEIILFIIWLFLWFIRGANYELYKLKDLHNIKANVVEKTCRFHQIYQQYVQIWINAHHFLCFYKNSTQLIHHLKTLCLYLNLSGS